MDHERDVNVKSRRSTSGRVVAPTRRMRLFAPERLTPSICIRSSVFSRRMACSPVSHHTSCHLLRYPVHWNFDAGLMAREISCMTAVTRLLSAEVGMQYAREVLYQVRVGMRTVRLTG